MLQKLGIFMFIFSLSLQAGAQQSKVSSDLKSQWALVDLAQDELISAILGHADAALTTRESLKADGSKALPTTIRVFKTGKLAKPSEDKRSSIKEWARLNTPAGKNGKGIILSERQLSENKYVIEFSTSSESRTSDLQSLYLALKDGDQVYLFVFDGIGSSVTRDKVKVKELFARLDAATLKELSQTQN